MFTYGLVLYNGRHCVCVYVCVCASACAQSRLTLYNPVDYSLPDSSVHGILQARILEWVAIPFCRIFPTKGSNWVSYASCIGRQILYH